MRRYSGAWEAVHKGPNHLVDAMGDYVGKSGFVSHIKHTAEATNMDLFHS